MNKAALNAKRSAFRPGVSSKNRATFNFAAAGYQMLTKRWGGPVGDIDVVLKRGLMIAFFEVNARNRLQVVDEVILPHTRSAGLSHLWKPDLQPTPNMRDTTCVPMRVLVTPDGMPQHAFRPSKSRLKNRSRA